MNPITQQRTVPAVPINRPEAMAWPGVSYIEAGKGAEVVVWVWVCVGFELRLASARGAFSVVGVVAATGRVVGAYLGEVSFLSSFSVGFFVVPLSSWSEWALLLALGVLGVVSGAEEW
jgi:hypothetical protein